MDASQRMTHAMHMTWADHVTLSGAQYRPANASSAEDSRSKQRTTSWERAVPRTVHAGPEHTLSMSFADHVAH
jgi:hypothetical protein